jgi:hypothetical protein
MRITNLHVSTHSNNQSILFILLIILNISQKMFGQNCLPPALTKEYSDSFEVIFIGKVNYLDQFDSTVSCNSIQEVFKGDMYHGNGKKFSFERIKCDVSIFEEDQWYLFYTNIKGYRLVAPVCSRTDLLDLRKDDIAFLNQLPCYEEVSAVRENGPCEKNLDPICDCEGNQYGNLCDAWRHGVLHIKKCP